MKLVDINPFELWWAFARLPFQWWRDRRKWTPVHRAANGYGLSWDRRRRP